MYRLKIIQSAVTAPSFRKRLFSRCLFDGSHRPFVLLCITLLMFSLSMYAQDTTNAINRDEFNFGHQLGYIYARMDDAFFEPRGTWEFETGLLSLYTSRMPLVRNNKWKERLFLYIPLYFEISPSDNIALQIEVTDLFIEFPYYDIRSMGGKSPRFKTKMRLRKEGAIAPAVAFTVGVKFSSAKPWVLWRHDHNFDESNGLTGAGTGVADYLLLFTISKTVSAATSVHTHFGLAPVGSPVEYTRGSAQADELPYGLSVRHRINTMFSSRLDLCGMYNGLSSTKLAHYSVVRGRLSYYRARTTVTFNIEHGLTEESDEWGAGLIGIFEFGKHAKAAAPE